MKKMPEGGGRARADHKALIRSQAGIMHGSMAHTWWWLELCINWAPAIMCVYYSFDVDLTNQVL